MKIWNTLRGLKFMISFTKIFYPHKIFKGKTVAVIGAADSAFEQENGNYINNFDYIIRINKAPHSLTSEKEKYIGNRTDILFHSFYENTISGGGPIDFELYERQGIVFLVNPNHTFKGLLVHLNYFKRNFHKHTSFILPRKFYKKMTRNFGKWKPTVGYSALYTVLNSGCEKVYITGFTFFQTPYADDYRDHFKDLNANARHIKAQGIHNPLLELKEFINQLNSVNSGTEVVLDKTLSKIVKNNK